MSAPARVGLVLVSHSAALAAGLRDLVAQMAPGVSIVAAGGTGAGAELGTSADLVAGAVTAADSGSGVAVLYDLGSARMSAEMAGEMIDNEMSGRVVVVDAAFVEGALAAGVAAAGDAPLPAVCAAAADARPAGDTGAAESGSADAAATGTAAEHTEYVTLRDPAGLHARPAAAVARSLAGLDARVRLAVGDRAADAGSLSGLLGLAAPAGTEVRISAGGPDAAVAAGRVADVLAEPGDEPPAETSVAGGEPSAAVPAAGADPLPAAPGRAVGALRRAAAATVRVPDETFSDVAAERARLAEALGRVRAELPDEGIAAAHRALLDDPRLVEHAHARVAESVPAAAAWWSAVAVVRDELAAVPDPVIAARAADVTDVGQRVLAALTGATPWPSVPAGSVLLADDVPPSAVGAMAEDGLAGIVLRAGGVRGHAAVLARSAGVPMVVCAADVLDAVADGTPVLVDGDTGRLLVDPPAEQVAAARPPMACAAGAPVYRADGGPLRLAANVASVADARAAAGAGADGVGLLRTEPVFAAGPRLPGEDEQLAWLTRILAACPPGPVVLRTVDLGGDKPAPALRLDARAHGFLGTRGLRLCLSRPELFDTHLRAVLRAGRVRPVRVMFPFVTDPGELAAARSALAAAADGLRRDGVDFAEPEAVGMMVEIPTAAVDAAAFLPLVDFLSVGSNDLAQYLSAADRTLGAVAAAYRSGERLVPRLVADVTAAAAGVGVPVSVCGDLAGDVAHAPRLVAAGVAGLSMAPPLLAPVRAALATAEPPPDPAVP